MTGIAKEYAQALYMLSAENDKTDEFLRHISLIGDIIQENPDYLKLLDSPALLLSERLSLIESAFCNAVNEHIVSFLQLMCENGHIKFLPECIDEFSILARAAQNCTQAMVYYAQPLNDSQKAALNQKLENLTRKSVEAFYIEDKSLIGGVKIDIDGKTLDGSISGRLNKIKGVINK